MPSRRNFGGSSMTLSFPPFAGAVKWLIIINLSVFTAWELLRLVDLRMAELAIAWLGLVPSSLAHGWLWQAFTYAFLHGGVLHLLANLVGMWFVGSLVEGIF